MARVREYGVDETGAPSSVLLGCAIGDIIPHFGTTPPPGTLVCDGSEISRETYHELFEEIGALCGPGDGSTTFELPDLRDVWLVWAGTQRGAGAKVSEGLPNITGNAHFRGYGNDASSPQSILAALSTENGAFSTLQNSNNVFQDLLQPSAQPSSGYSGNILQLDASRNSSIYGASQHVTPASVAVLPCIVYE